MGNGYYNSWISVADTYNIGILAWQWNDVTGSVSVSNWEQNNYGTPFTFTGGTGGVSSTTLTVSSGSGLGQGLVLTTNFPADRSYIQKQLSGTPGGAGTYQMSVAQSIANGTTLTGVYYVPSTQGTGGATTLANWMLAHAP
jgi:hypothetical protein